MFIDYAVKHLIQFINMKNREGIIRGFIDTKIKSLFLLQLDSNGITIISQSNYNRVTISCMLHHPLRLENTQYKQFPQKKKRGEKGYKRVQTKGSVIGRKEEKRERKEKSRRRKQKTKGKNRTSGKRRAGEKEKGCKRV